jgi:Zn-dependent membrane protease YugP
MFYFDPRYWLFIGPALLFMLYAQWRVRSAYAKWGKVANSRNIPGVRVAEQLMQENGLYGVSIRGIRGQLTDNYDPRNKTLNLSESTARTESVASLAIVAHEVGHAMQDATGYFLLRLRGGLVPAVNFGSQLGPLLFFVGLILQFRPLMWIGIVFFSAAFIFALVTLPVEINASRRAMNMLTSSGLVMDGREKNGARAVLTAAALTYVAALLTALFQLLYYVMLASGGRRRN